MKFNVIQRVFSLLYAIVTVFLFWEILFFDIGESLIIIFVYILMMVALSGETPKWLKKLK
jgi:hypothetical protein